jgi:DHA1 family inner membrane transport protein
MWMLSRPATPFAFATSTFAFLYAWTFSLPFLLAVVASRDRTGRLSVLINLMIGAGLGFGPVIFAAMLKVPPDYRIAIPMAIVAGTVSLCLALAADRLPNREFPNETAG